MDGDSVGRAHELKQLETFAERASGGRGTIAVVTGEPGIGKTRLAGEALEDCRRRGFEAYLAVASEMEQHRPFGLITDALRLRAARDPGRAGIRRLLRGSGDADATWARHHAGLEFLVAEHVVEYVGDRGMNASPVAIVLEDVQWADPSSLTVLSRLAREGERLPLLLICTLRPHPGRPEVRALLASLASRGASHLELGPLSDGDVGHLVALLAGAPPGGRLLHLTASANGNPLHVRELVTALQASGALATGPDGQAEVTEGPLPTSLRQVILRRLAGLPAATLDLQHTASFLERVAAHLVPGGGPGDTQEVNWPRRAARGTATHSPAVAVGLPQQARDLCPADGPARAGILGGLIQRLAWDCRREELAALCRRGLDSAGRPEGAAAFRTGLSHSLFIQGSLAVAIGELTSGRADRALGMFGALAAGEPGIRWGLQLLRAAALLDLDQVDRARTVLREGASGCALNGTPARAAIYHHALVAVEYAAGDFDAAHAEHDTALSLEEEPVHDWGLISFGLSAAVAVHRGQLGQAAQTVRVAEAGITSFGPQPGDNEVARARYLMALATGDGHLALAAACEAWQRCSSHGYRSHLTWLGADLVRAALSAGAREQAETAVAAAQQVATVAPAACWKAGAARAQGLLADDPELLLHAVTLSRASHRPLCLALALEDAADALARTGQIRDARPLAVEALELFAGMEAVTDAARARRRWRAASLHLGARGPRSRPSTGWDSLSDGELRVVRLVAEGRTNRDIAERLFVSRNTVHTHLSSALRKLGVSSRVELATQAVRRGM